MVGFLTRLMRTNHGGISIPYTVCSICKWIIQYILICADFKLVHWGAVAQNIPAMFALTFFGVLHVPINIPALAFNIGEDHLDLDRELVAHGISNALSGF